MKPRVIIIDLDGTAVDSPENVLPSSRLVEAVHELKKHVHVCAATGRCLTTARDIIDSLELQSPCILSGGSQLYHPLARTVMWQQNIDHSTLDGVIEVLSKALIRTCVYNNYSAAEYFAGGVSLTDVDLHEDVYWMAPCFLTRDQALRLADTLQEHMGIACTLATSQKPDLFDLHIVHKAATKKHAVTALLGMLGYDKREAIGVGDGHNDLDLFEAVGTRVAMGNAVPELKRAADTVIEHVAADGLAQYFESLIHDLS